MRLTIPFGRRPRHRATCQQCSALVERTVLTWDAHGQLIPVCVPCLTAAAELEHVMGLAR